jgi:hypothetical protein
MTEKIRIDGIQISNELAAIIFRNLPKDAINYISRFCRILTQNKVNIHFLSMADMGRNHQISCCVAEEDRVRVRDMMEADFGGIHEVEFVSSVGLLTLFPHQCSLKILGLVLYIFGKESLPLHGLASSLSALSLITDYAHRSKAVAALQAYMDVPPGQIMFQSEFQVKQSDQVKPE